MTVRHMRIFCAVCENDCSTTKAAAQLNMSQPAVSLAVKELEDSYEVRLFNRIGRRLSITSAGEIFLRYARRILALFSGVEREMRDWNRFGKLRIGASLTIGGQLLPRYVGLFKKCHPEAEIDVLVAPSSELEQKVLDNELDFALVERGTMYAPAVCFHTLYDRFPGHCLCGGRDVRQGQINSIWRSCRSTSCCSGTRAAAPGRSSSGPAGKRALCEQPAGNPSVPRLCSMWPPRGWAWQCCPTGWWSSRCRRGVWSQYRWPAWICGGSFPSSSIRIRFLTASAEAFIRSVGIVKLRSLCRPGSWYTEKREGTGPLFFVFQ